jgi:hypothetical protein
MAAELPRPDGEPQERFIRAPHAIAKERDERSDKSEDTAIQIMRIIADLHKAKDQPMPSANKFADYCETMWQWVVTDQWPSSP